MALRLKRKALEWLHSKPEYIGMPLDEFLKEMRGVFWHRENKIMLRMIFENRAWKKDETFSEYVHKKTILGNRIPIDKGELIIAYYRWHF